MPEMWFSARWPDGTERNYYSPSLVVHDHLTEDTDYLIKDFVERSTTAMNEASERVRAKYGFACTSAAETSARIRQDAVGAAGTVHVTALKEIIR